MSKLTRLTGINTTMKHAPAKPTVNHLAFVTCIRRHCPRHGGEVLKDEIQASNYENCTLKQKVDMLENNNRVQHNATQGCNQPLLTLLYTEEMADQVLVMYWVEHSIAGLGWWII